MKQLWYRWTGWWERRKCRAAFAGVKAYSWAVHIHHAGPWWLEALYRPPEERIAVIAESKPRWQHARRYRLMRPVPSDLLPPTLVLAGERMGDALEQRRMVVAHLNAGRRLAKELQVAGEAVAKAEAELGREAVALLDRGANYHAVLCQPDCPWDGKSIFPEHPDWWM